MKYFFLILVAMACGLVYVRSDQPNLWNQWVKTLNLPPSLAIDTASSAMAPVPSDHAPSASATYPATAPEQATPILITPSATNYINPDHVHDVPQPLQPNAAANSNSKAPAP